MVIKLFDFLSKAFRYILRITIETTKAFVYAIPMFFSAAGLFILTSVCFIFSALYCLLIAGLIITIPILILFLI